MKDLYHFEIIYHELKDNLLKAILSGSWAQVNREDPPGPLSMMCDTAWQPHVDGLLVDIHRGDTWESICKAEVIRGLVSWSQTMERVEVKWEQ